MSHVDRDALTAAMAVAPGVYARNRMFAFFKDPRVQLARVRASVIRGVVRHLAGGNEDRREFSFSSAGDETVVLRYRIPHIHMERTLELTALEAACVAYLGGRARVVGLEPTNEQRALVDAALARLAASVDATPATPITRDRCEDRQATRES